MSVCEHGIEDKQAICTYCHIAALETEIAALRTENARLIAMAEADAFEIGRVKKENAKLHELDVVARAACVAALEERDAARRECEEVSVAIGTVEFMDPPDGGSVTLAEQVARMREALATARHECEEYEAAINLLQPNYNTGRVEVDFGWEELPAVRRAHDRRKP